MRSASAIAGAKQETPTPEEQHLYTNLCILGIANSHARIEGVELTRTCFRRSNNKTLEHVLMRLFTIIEGKARAQKEFKGMVPVLDKVQQAPFYQKIWEWMNELKKAGRLEPSVILPVSALKTNTSNRLVLLLLELSVLALHHELESTRPGACRAAFMQSPGSVAPTAPGVAGMNGLLDESSLLPAELRLAISVSRCKEVAAEVVEYANTASHTADAMEQRCSVFKGMYYKLREEMAHYQAPQAEAAAAEAGARTPRTEGPASVTTAPGGSSVLCGPGAGALASSFSGFGVTGTGTGSAEQPPQQDSPKPRKDPSPEQVARVSALVAKLREHLNVQDDLAKVLMTDDTPDGGAAATADGRSAAVPGVDASAGGQPNALPSQRLHPHQIDGAVLAADAAAATASACMAADRQSAQDAGQRRQQASNLTPFAADNIVVAVQSFSALLRSLTPQVIQLAMAGENAGPRPLLQPPSKPSSHAAHAAHQLQVHEHASRQVLQLRRKAQEEVAACDVALQGLLAVDSRVKATSYTDYGSPDADLRQRPGQYGQQPYGPAARTTGSGADGGAAFAAREAAGWRSPGARAGEAPPQHGLFVSARGITAARSPAPAPMALSPKALINGADAANEVALLQARMRNLRTGNVAPTSSAASMPAASAPAPSTAGPSSSGLVPSNSTATSCAPAWNPLSPAGLASTRAEGLFNGTGASQVVGSPINTNNARAWMHGHNFNANAGGAGGMPAAGFVQSPTAPQPLTSSAYGGASPGWPQTQALEQPGISRVASAYDASLPPAFWRQEAPNNVNPLQFGMPPSSTSNPSAGFAAVGQIAAGSDALRPSATMSPMGGTEAMDMRYLLDDDEPQFLVGPTGGDGGGFGRQRSGSSPGDFFGHGATVPCAPAFGTSGGADSEGSDDFAMLARESQRLSLAFGAVPSPPAAHAPIHAADFPAAFVQGRRRGGSAWGSSCGGGTDTMEKETGGTDLGTGGGATGNSRGCAEVDCVDDVQMAAMDVDMRSPQGMHMLTLAPQAASPPATLGGKASGGVADPPDPMLLALKARMQAVTSKTSVA